MRQNGRPVPVVADMQRLAMSVIGRALLSADQRAGNADFGIRNAIVPITVTTSYLPW